MNESEYDELMKEIKATTPERRARDVTWRAYSDLVDVVGVPPEHLQQIVEALYNLGWQDAMLFFGRPDATWPDGTPFQRSKKSGADEVLPPT